MQCRMGRKVSTARIKFTVTLNQQLITCFFTDFDTHLSINTTGILTSPYYPLFYLNNLNRRWHLQTLKNHKINLQFLYLNIERDPTCKNDYIMIQDGGTTSNDISYYCGKTMPEIFKSRSNKLLIVFKTNEEIVRTGFKIQYSVVKGKGHTFF